MAALVTTLYFHNYDVTIVRQGEGHVIVNNNVEKRYAMIVYTFQTLRMVSEIEVAVDYRSRNMIDIPHTVELV